MGDLWDALHAHVIITSVTFYLPSKDTGTTDYAFSKPLETAYRNCYAWNCLDFDFLRCNIASPMPTLPHLKHLRWRDIWTIGNSTEAWLILHRHLIRWSLARHKFRTIKKPPLNFIDKRSTDIRKKKSTVNELTIIFISAITFWRASCYPKPTIVPPRYYEEHQTCNISEVVADGMGGHFIQRKRMNLPTEHCRY